MEILNFLKTIGIEFALLIAGFAGGLTSINKNQKLNLKQKILVIVSGGFIATYLTPVFIDVLNLQNANSKYGIAFVIGYMGLKSIEFLVSKFTKSNSNADS
tara:strand:- start:217 stop:519 length:303 start_codon:yes stop_codon:yes gene_type:complete